MFRPGNGPDRGAARGNVQDGKTRFPTLLLAEMWPTRGPRASTNAEHTAGHRVLVDELNRTFVTPSTARTPSPLSWAIDGVATDVIRLRDRGQDHLGTSDSLDLSGAAPAGRFVVFFWSERSCFVR